MPEKLADLNYVSLSLNVAMHLWTATSSHNADMAENLTKPQHGLLVNIMP